MQPQDPTRRLILALPAVLAGAPLLVPGAAGAQTLTGTARDSAVADVSRAVNAVTRLQGRFAQTDPDGTVVTGQFWLQRPGRLRFEYDAPSPLLMVSDGSTVAVQDRRLNSVDRFPLRSTPLWFLLKDRVNLATEVNVTEAARRDGKLFLTMRDRAREAEGQITVVFEERDRSLEEWTVRDGQNRSTRVRLVSSSVPARIEPQLFILRDPPSRRKR
jgi:outer membrane lipoprotein-sorting protein